jgi:hypothetical protein
MTARAGRPDPARWGPPIVVVGLWLVTRIALLVLALDPNLYSGAILGDVVLYAAKVERMFQGELPYRDIAIEYPPGSVPFTFLPALVAGTGEYYRLAFAMLMLVVDMVGLLVANALGRVLEPIERLREGAWDWGGSRVPLAYVVGVFLAGPLLLVRFDIVPAVCVMLACLYAIRGRPAAAAVAIGYGAAAKLFPAVLAPLLILGFVPALGWARTVRRTIPAFAIGAGLTVVPALLFSFSGTITSVLLYHTRRGVQIESLWASGIELAHVIGGLPIAEVFQYGAFDLGSSVSGLAKTLSSVVTLGAIAFAAWATWSRARRRGGLAGSDWVLVMGLGIFAFMLPTRVLSPQYLLWLGILAAAVATPRARAAWVMWCLAGPVTQLIFPFRYNQLRLFHPLEVGMLTVRNALLVAAAVVLARALFDGDRGAGLRDPALRSKERSSHSDQGPSARFSASSG